MAAAFAQRFTIERFLLAQVTATVVIGGVAASLGAGAIPSVNAASVVFTLCIAWMLYSWARIVHTIVSPYWIFVLVAALFNGGHALLQVFGLNPNGVLESRFSIGHHIKHDYLRQLVDDAAALRRAVEDDAGAPAGS